MKNIFKSLIVLAAGVLVLGSCAEETAEPLSASVGVNSNELILPDTGSISGTINVTADGEWFATASEQDWFTFSPSYGNGSGSITVTGVANVDGYGEVNGPRSGVITVIGSEGMQAVTVKQIGESGLDASRTYSKVTKAEDLEAGQSYLIVANDGKELQAAKAFAASSESTYSYLYTDVVEEKDGVITRNNANNGFTLVAKGEGYALQMPGGRYLFQAAAYNNFYSTESLDKADVWKVTVNGDGTVKLENLTVAGKYFQYSIGYTSYGSYGSPQSNAVLPSLYKDAAAPSDEILTVPETTTVAGGITEVSIPVTSNKTWKVRCHDSWIKSFTASGSGDGAIKVTFDANTSYEEAKEATFQIIGETTNFTVKLIQDHLYPIIDATVAEFQAAEVGDQLYRLTGKVREIVNATYGNIYLEDGTGYVYVYTLFENDSKVAKSFSNLGLRAGDIVTIVGPRAEYAGAKVEDQKIQMANAYCESTIKSTDASVSQVLAAPVASTYLESPYYRVTGKVKEVVNATYGNLYLQEEGSDAYIYVYGVTNAPVKSNNKSFGSLGVKAGDVLTIVGQRGEYPGSKVEDQKIQMANSYYISHESIITEKLDENYIVYAGKKYDVVRLADGRWWMASPLAYVPEGKTVSSDPTDGNGIWYAQTYDKDGKATARTDFTDGYLYDCPTAFGVSADDITYGTSATAEEGNYRSFEGTQGICPPGWYIPVHEDFLKLVGVSNKVYGGAGAINDNTAVYYDSTISGGGSTVVAFNNAGWNFSFLGVVARTSTTNTGSYNQVRVDESTGCTVESFMGLPRLNQVMCSTPYQPNVSGTNVQYFCVMSTFTKNYPTGRLSLSYLNYLGGSEVRCIRKAD